VFGVPEVIRRAFVTLLDITAEKHILMQSVVLEHCRNAISKAVNFLNSGTREQIREDSSRIWKRKCN
jgi:ribonucleoside-diphosphate reductase alpha chain